MAVGSRSFDGFTYDELGLDVGTSTGALTAYTIGGVFYPKVARNEFLCSVGTSGGTAVWEAGRLSSGALWMWSGASFGYAEFSGALPIDTWRIWLLSKVAGSNTIRCHLYDFDTDTWSHTDGPSVGDSGSPGSGGIWWIADYPTGTQAHLTGDAAVFAVWRLSLIHI